MATTGDRIRSRRIELGLSVDELAKKLGKNRATVYRYENGDIGDLPTQVLESIAVVLDTTPADLMGWKTIASEKITIHNLSSHAVRIPVLGRVAAGIPLDAVEEIIDYEEITDAMAKDGEYFGLQIKGDSMEPKFSNGDVVIVRKQEDASDGDIVIALVNGNDAVCKRLKKYADGAVALVSTNPAYAPIYFSGEEVDKTPVRIIGKVKELRAKF